MIGLVVMWRGVFVGNDRAREQESLSRSPHNRGTAGSIGMGYGTVRFTWGISIAPGSLLEKSGRGNLAPTSPRARGIGYWAWFGLEVRPAEGEE